MSLTVDRLGQGTTNKHLSPSVAAPVDWWDTSFERRHRISVTNNSGSDLYDHIVTYTPTVTMDAGSLRVIEGTSLGPVDRAFDWRYAVGGTSDMNRMPLIPSALSGGVVTFKVLGRWASGETRYFGIYWSVAGGQSAPTFSHLDCTAGGWTATALAGTAGDTYALVVGGTTYSYVMIGGDTATTIATALKNAINAGTVATATSSSGVVTIKTKTPRVWFTVANTGTTVVGNLAVVKPTYFPVGRVGPDTEQFGTSTSLQWQFPSTATSAGVALNRVSLGRNTSECLRTFHYSVNGDGTSYGTIDAVPTSVTVNPTSIQVAGNITFSTRSAAVDWAGTYTATQYNKICGLQKNDITGGAHAVPKYVDVTRLVMTFTCQRAYNPTSVATNATGAGGHEVFCMGDLDNSFASNVTIAAGNKVTNFYVSGGVVTAYAANADLTGLGIAGQIVGSAGNTHAQAVLINSASVTGFTGQPNVAFKWCSNGNTYGFLQLVGLTSGATIPVGAQITVDLWYIGGITLSATSFGDSLVPTEVVNLIQNVAYAPTPTLIADETSTASGLLQTMQKAADRCLTGIKWYQANGPTDTTVAGNYSYQKNVQTGFMKPADDDDGGYGESYKLQGLCLRYLRTKDPTLIPVIENQVNFHIGIEAAAVAAYGSFWSGSAPFWYWPSPTSSGSTYTTEGGITSCDFSQVDPGFGGTLGPITYTQGQVRRCTSIDQLQTVSGGLYAYLYLLRNEQAVTQNATLRTNALSLLNRMKSFESTHWTNSSCIIDNLYALCSGATPTHNNGITATLSNTQTATAIANPYRGIVYGPWQDSNTDNAVLTISSNGGMLSFFRAVFAPDSTNAGILNFLSGYAMDMMASDIAKHTDVASASVTTQGVVGAYPAGWMVRSQGSTKTRYNAANSGDKHYIEVGTGGDRDTMSLRGAQRLCVLALMALLNPNYLVPCEEPGIRTVPITTAVNDAAHAFATFGPEPTTQAQRFCVGAWLGKSSSFDPQIIDSAYTGYWMMAIELWFLVQQRTSGSNPLPALYKFTGV